MRTDRGGEEKASALDAHESKLLPRFAGLIATATATHCAAERRSCRKGKRVKPEYIL
jgi:hypothetical protein